MSDFNAVAIYILCFELASKLIVLKQYYLLNYIPVQSP